MSAKTKLTAKIEEALTPYLKDHPEIYFAMLYGSATEGLPFRDVDIGLFVDRSTVPPHKDLDYSIELTHSLTTAVPYPVDVRIINDAPLGFRYNVSRGQPLVINDERAFFHFLERTWDEYLDFEPLAKQYLWELR